MRGFCDEFNDLFKGDFIVQTKSEVEISLANPNAQRIFYYPCNDVSQLNYEFLRILKQQVTAMPIICFADCTQAQLSELITTTAREAGVKVYVLSDSDDPMKFRTDHFDKTQGIFILPFSMHRIYDLKLASEAWVMIYCKDKLFSLTVIR
jgi:hypothetical protein